MLKIRLCPCRQQLRCIQKMCGEMICSDTPSDTTWSALASECQKRHNRQDRKRKENGAGRQHLRIAWTGNSVCSYRTLTDLKFNFWTITACESRGSSKSLSDRFFESSADTLSTLKSDKNAARNDPEIYHPKACENQLLFDPERNSCVLFRLCHSLITPNIVCIFQ